MATTGTVVVSLFGGNRETWRSGDGKIKVIDPFTDKISDRLPVDTMVKKPAFQARITDLPTDKGQRYWLLLDAVGHRGHAVSIKPIPGGELPVNVMLIRKEPQPDFSQSNYNNLQLNSPIFHGVLSKNVPEAGFLGLAKKTDEDGPSRMMAALNIDAKLRATPLKSGRAVTFLREIDGLDSLERDRIKALVAADMPSNVSGVNNFTKLKEEFNEVNHKGFPVSFKEKVQTGSLQLSFAKRPLENSLLPADIDIDLFTDIGHLGEVMRNKILKTKTDQFTVYVQLFDQAIKPLYTVKI